MIQKCKEQKELINKFISQAQSSSTCISINNIQNQNVINIYNNYGHKDLSYITNDHDLLTHCINNPKSGSKG
jgi:hypothetical protein